MQICGIDYGSKLSGTTVICFQSPTTSLIQWRSSEKKKDADVFIKQQLMDLKPEAVFIDAPLSLPRVYSLGPEENPEPDFFFREGDKELKAMSPLFLGGLTARAMKLAWELRPLAFFETYPAVQARRLQLGARGYKKAKEEIKGVIEQIKAFYPMLDWDQDFKNWHEVDALLAWIGGYRWAKGEGIGYGAKDEGQIYI